MQGYVSACFPKGCSRSKAVEPGALPHPQGPQHHHLHELCLQNRQPGSRTHGDTSGPPGVVTSNLSAGWCPSFLQHAHGRVWRKVVTLGRSTPSASWGRFRGATNRDSRQTSSVLAGLGQCEEETKPVGGDRTGRGYLTSGDRL